jgi:hypothetical protein
MSSVRAAGLWMMSVFIVLGGFSSRNAWSQTSPGASAEKLPPDVDPNTLSRMPRAKRSDFTAEDELKAFDEVMSMESRFAAQTGAIGGTLTRVQLPTVGLKYRDLLNEMQAKCGIEKQYRELTIIVASRESKNATEWVAHAKNVPSNLVDIVRNNKDVSGLDEKEATLIRFGREMARDPRVSSKTFADMERLFGRRSTLAITLINSYYAASAMLFRTYDQHLNPGVPYPFPSH